MFDLSNITTNYRAKIIIKAYKKWIHPNLTALDVGCGNGKVSSQVSQHFKVKLKGCDVIDYNQSNLKFVLMKDINTLPFKDKEFDIVMINDVLHHISKVNQKLLLEDALRVGKKVLVFETTPSILTYVLDYIVNRFHNLSMHIPLAFRSLEQWQNLFDDSKISYETVHIPKPNFYPFTNIAFSLSKHN